jgi:hypothetical protein
VLLWGLTMTDIVERLRNAAARKWPNPDVAECSFFSEAADEISLLRDECDGLRRDAERYRWIRNRCYTEEPFPELDTVTTVAQLDAVIDAAIEASRGTK